MARAKETRRKENRKAYASRKTIEVPQPCRIIQALSSEEISEDSPEKHLYAHYSVTAGPLELPGTTLTETDFGKMMGHPPYPSHIVDLSSFEKDWPKISAAFHGYATRMFVLEQTKWRDQAVNCDRASLSTELLKLYRDLTAAWKQFGDEVQEYGYARCLPTEFIAFQNRLWLSRRLMWLSEDLKSLVEGTDALFLALQSRLRSFI